MSFLSFHSRRSCVRPTIARCLRQQTASSSSTRVPSLEVDQNSFEAAGIHPMVAASLRIAFPTVRKPTAMQRKLIRAMARNRDVLLQDDTGTGKSFVAMLALLSKFSAQRSSPVTTEVKDGTGKALTGLLIVPHRDLAYQYLHWIHHMTLPEGDAPSSLMKYAQVLVRNVNKSTLRGLPIRMQAAIKSASADQDLLIHQPPHILITTPNAVLELIERQSVGFRLATPSIVVVDEADAQLRVPGSKHPKGRRRASQKKLGKHVPDLVRILDRFFPWIGDRALKHQRSSSAGDESVERGRATHRPQLVMISATLRSRLQNALFNTFGWIQHGEVLKLIRKRSPALPCHRLGRSAVHHVLVVSKTGDIRNIVGARPSEPNANSDGALSEQDDDDDGEVGAFYDDGDDPELVDEGDKELVRAPLAIDPAVLEAVAATFALDVPRVALLVLPATAAVRKIIFELRQLGVDAHPLDLVENEASRAHILRRTDGVTDENPVLIVATLATVRGIDLPELSHVMMVGVPEGRSGDTYLHVAGRVGRFGGRGKMITIVEEGRGDAARRMRLVLSRIGVQATRLEHFD